MGGLDNPLETMTIKVSTTSFMPFTFSINVVITHKIDDSSLFQVKSK